MTKLIVLFGFVLSFAAGMLLFSRLEQPAESMSPTAPSTQPATQPWDLDDEHHGPHHGPPGMRGGFLPRELNLTDDQQQKFREIWSKLAMQGPREMESKRRDLFEGRDQQIAALVPAEKKADYEKIQSDFTARMSAMDAGFRKQFDDAVQQTEALLTPEQRTKYEALRSRMRPPEDRDHGHGGPGGPDEHGPMPFGGPGGFGGGPGGPPPEPRD